MQKLPPGLAAGSRVVVRGEPWIVVHTEPFERCTALTLRGSGDGNFGETCRVLSPFDRVRASREQERLIAAKRQSVLAAVARAMLRIRRWNRLWTAATARIDLLPWQLEPAAAAIGGATRLLLADTVGLGKTIQAALIVTELMARGLASRVLILTPASLREQWANELRDRFDLRPAVLDRAAVMRLVSDLPPGVNPWSTADLIVSSIDLVKRPEIRAALDGAHFDLLIVDEAHHLTPASDRAAVAADLASRTPWVVLATATPHSGDERSFSYLKTIGQCGERDDLVIFRRTHAIGAQRARPRRLRVVAVRPSESEQTLLAETLRYAQDIWRHRIAGEGAALVAAIIARRATSGAFAVRQTLARRLALLDGPQAAREEQAPLPWDESELSDAVEADAVLGLPGLADRSTELQRLRLLIPLADAALCSSAKAAAVLRLVERSREPAIVFSEYRDTLEHLRPMLETRCAVAMLHGGLSAAARRESLRQFVDGRVLLLLASDAAGEGLNLQQRCRLVINVETPWTPQRLEQRIGRVDRLGQTRRVHVRQLCYAGTFEDEVLARLQERTRRAGRDLAAASCTELEIASRVLGGEPVATPAQDAARNDTPTSGYADSALAHDAARERDLRERLDCRTVRRRGGARVAMVGSRNARHWTLVFECDLHDASGRVAGRELVPLGIAVAGSTRRTAPRALIRALRDAPVSRDHLTRELAIRAAAAQVQTAASSEAIGERLRAMRARLDERRAPAPYQASLFDRRAEQRAHADACAHQLLRSAVERRLSSAEALKALAPGPARLIAAWPSGPPRAKRPC